MVFGVTEVSVKIILTGSNKSVPPVAVSLPLTSVALFSKDVPSTFKLASLARPACKVSNPYMSVGLNTFLGSIAIKPS